MNIRRLLFDVDKALSRPSVLDIARAIESCASVAAFNILVEDIDVETLEINVTIEGENLGYDEIVRNREHRSGGPRPRADRRRHAHHRKGQARAAMNILTDRRHRLDIIAGLVDGILNALVLATAKLTGPASGVTLHLAVRVGAATALRRCLFSSSHIMPNSGPSLPMPSAN
jgi:uncharacterized protein